MCTHTKFRKRMKIFFRFRFSSCLLDIFLGQINIFLCRIIIFFSSNHYIFCTSSLESEILKCLEFEVDSWCCAARAAPHHNYKPSSIFPIFLGETFQIFSLSGMQAWRRFSLKFKPKLYHFIPQLHLNHLSTSWKSNL